MGSKTFNVKAAGLTLPYEFYTFDDIQEDLKKTFGNQVKSYDMSIDNKWSQIRKGNYAGAKFFTYIKFFIDIETKEIYGLIGGKTNYDNPDILLYDVEENEHRFGRLFVQTEDENKKEKYKMSNLILVIHHNATDEDSLQAIFIERYVQRKYNLFDS